MDDKTNTEIVTDAGRLPVTMAGANFAGAAANFMANPLLAGGLGPAGGQMISVLHDLSARMVSPRQARRMDRAGNTAIALIRIYQEENKHLRTDDFFTPQADDRAPAETIFEGVLLKASNAFEEKKVPFLGSIFANVAFRPDVSAGSANYILHLGEGLTYRQLCILALLHTSAQVRDRRKWWQGYYAPQPSSLVALELKNMGEVLEPASNAEVAPRLSAVGNLVFELMGLDRLELSDLMATLAAFTAEL